MSSRYRRDVPETRRYYWQGARLWAGSYLAGAVSDPPLSMLHQYIEQQNRPD
ncbi:transposase [Micromonospora viridifaciens]|uniref:transposase n=1 Tax=Micromonospora viridifaciens TaxID=1881 RepID=UPI0022B263CA|nr:transposase [Micromonospora viridifaciens]